MSARRLTLLASAAVCGAAFLAAPAAEAAPVRVKAMTRNLYLGADLVPIAAAQNREQLERRVADTLQQVRANDFNARAALIAREVKRHKPDLIGIQEAGIWRTGPKDSPAPAQDVVYDYLAILRRAFARAGLRYRLGRVTRELDIEGPSADGQDVRFTQQDTLFVRRRPGLRVLRQRSDNFDARFDFPSQTLGNVPIPRGWQSADLSFRGKRFRFVNVHTEAYNADINTAQTRELVARRGPARSRRPVILAGDLNSDPQGREQAAGAYNVVRAARFTDTWVAANRTSPGFTFGVDAALRTPDFDRRIDFVFERGRFRTLRSARFGTSPVNGRWASDHAGVVTTLLLP